MRAKKSYPRTDRYGCYMEACSEIARELGADVVSVYAEWNDRVQAYIFTADMDADDCEARALEDVKAAYSKGS